VGSCAQFEQLAGQPRSCSSA